MAALTEEGNAGKDDALAAEVRTHGDIAAQLPRSAYRAITRVDLDPETYRYELESNGWTSMAIDPQPGRFVSIRTDIDRKVGRAIEHVIGPRPLFDFDSSPSIRLRGYEATREQHQV